jgi:hypothetical protein
MKKRKFVIYAAFVLLFIVSCTSKKGTNDAYVSDMDSVAVMDSVRPDMPPPPPDSGRFDGHRPPPPPAGMHPDGPPPPPPHGKGRPPHKPDNMRGFDPASEDDMDDNGMSRYMENNDEEGWD